MKIAMISGWHVHAKGYAKEALAIPGVEIKTVWDEDPVRGEQWADELGCDFVADYAQVMADEEIDGVVIDASLSNWHITVRNVKKNEKNTIEFEIYGTKNYAMGVRAYGDKE